MQTAPTGRTPLGSDRDTYLQPVLRDRGNKTATERCKNPATKRTKPQEHPSQNLFRNRERSTTPSGRPPAMTPEKIEAAMRLRNSGQSLAQIASALEVSKSTIHRALAPSDGSRTQEAS
ncbi:helix-turn-helix domain-containing protein [Brachybacterium sp. p3-SID957]